MESPATAPTAPPEGSQLPALPDAARKRPNLALHYAIPAGMVPAGAKVERLNLPPIIKPREVSGSISIGGEVIAVIESPVATYKSKLLWFKCPAGEFLFPITAVVKSALARHFKVERDAFDAQKAVGLHLIIANGAQSETLDGRPLNLHEVFVVKP